MAWEFGPGSSFKMVLLIKDWLIILVDLKCLQMDDTWADWQPKNLLPSWPKFDVKRHADLYHF